jgi:hypothetical protein
MHRLKKQGPVRCVWAGAAKAWALQGAFVNPLVSADGTPQGQHFYSASGIPTWVLTNGAATADVPPVKT